MVAIDPSFANGNILLAPRESGEDDGHSDLIMDLVIAFLGVSFLALLLVAGLLVMRRVKRKRAQQSESLPQYNDIKQCDNSSNNRATNRLTIQTADGRSSILVVNGKPMLADPESPPHSPNNIPEIHITFPDEHDDDGRQQNGRVVVVRMGETSVGMEPVKEQLPAYEKESPNGFYSIDMDKIGGLKEKDRNDFA